MALDIDRLLPETGLIQLGPSTPNDFGLNSPGDAEWKLERIHGDVLLCEYIDVSPDGMSITRGKIFIPLNAQTKAWRKARVVLCGQDAKYTKEGEIVLFPHNYGVEVKNVETSNGKVVDGVFLNESRIFGACSK